MISDYVWNISMQIEFKSSRGISAHHVQTDRYTIDRSSSFIVSHNWMSRNKAQNAAFRLCLVAKLDSTFVSHSFNESIVNTARS